MAAFGGDGLDFLFGAVGKVAWVGVSAFGGSSRNGGVRVRDVVASGCVAAFRGDGLNLLLGAIGEVAWVCVAVVGHCCRSVLLGLGGVCLVLGV